MHSWSGEVLHDLKLLIQSRYGIVHLDSNEEDRVQTLLRHTADSLGVDLFLWSPTRGLGRADLEGRIYDAIALADEAQGISGAEIEQVVLSGLYESFSSQVPLNDAALVREIRATRPLSVTMAEKIDHMRAWAQGRAVLAN